MRRLTVILGLVLAASVVSEHSAAASGYHPGFDRAVKEADWIILHTVVSDHAPRTKLAGIPSSRRFTGRVFLVRVKRSFKGPFRKGDMLYIWDGSHNSTAGYFLRKGRDNLTFLVKPKRRSYIAKVHVRSGTMDVGAPIRNLTGAFGKGRALHVRGWLRKLELTRVGSRPIPLRDMRKVIRRSKSPALLRYVLTHWTGRLSKNDAAAVKALLTRPGATAMVTGAALELLRKKGVGLSVKSLRAQLVSGPKYARGRMLKQINARNARGVRDVLWGWVKRDEQSALDALSVLGRHQRRYLIGKLRRNRLPFWLDIPALQVVRTNVGRRYSASAMKLSRWQLVGAGRLVKGKTFGASYSMQTRKPVWAEMIKLVIPLLPTMKREARELTLAVARTWGYQVRRKGKSASLGARTAVPLSISVARVPGARHKIMVIERASRNVLVCTKTLRRVAISKGRNSVTSTDSTLGGWYNTKTARNCFKRRKGVVQTQVVDLASLVKNIKKPGMYEVSVDLLHSHSGSEHGLNGWTGMVYSNKLSISLP